MALACHCSSSHLSPGLSLIDKDTRDISKGAVVNFAGTAARSIHVLFIILLARLFGPEIAGMFILSRAGLDVLSKLGAVGLDRGLLSLLSRHVAAKDWAGAYRVIGQFLFVGGITTGGLVLLVQFFASPLAEGVYHDRALTTALRVLGVTAVFYFFTSVFLSATRAMRIMHYEVITKSVVEPATLLVLSVIVYIAGWGFQGLCLALMFSSVVGSLLAIYLFSKSYSILRTFGNILNFYQLRNLVHYTIPVGLHDVMNVLLLRIDLFLVDRFLSSAAVGIYGVAQEISSVLKTPKQSFDPIFIPVMAQAYERGDRETMRIQYQNVSRWVMLIAAGLLGFMVVAMEPITALFGPEFSSAAGVVYLIGAAFLVNGMIGIGESILLINRPGINLLNTMGAVLINLILGLVLIEKFGIYGAALGGLGAFIMLNGARVLEVYWLEQVHPFTRYHARGFFAAIVPGTAIVFFIHHFTLPLSVHLMAGVMFLLLYAGMLVMFGFAAGDRQVMRTGLARLRSYL